jgi:co-chaperonin GroES (HSP10)
MPSARLAYQTPGQLSDAAEAALPEELRKTLQAEFKERKKLMSDDLFLPPLLEERRQEFGITDGAFALAPFDDRILLYQVSRHKDETHTGTSILMAPTTREREEKQTPQGIVVAAGAKALDSLRCNGIDLGHMVMFLRIAPWRFVTDNVQGKDEEVIVLRVGDIVGSIDLQDQLRKGEVKVVFDKERYEHAYQDTKTNDVWYPQSVDPLIPEDM